MKNPVEDFWPQNNKTIYKNLKFNPVLLVQDIFLFSNKSIKLSPTGCFGFMEVRCKHVIIKLIFTV